MRSGKKPQVGNQKLPVLIFYANSLSIDSRLFSLLSHVESIVDIWHGGHITWVTYCIHCNSRNVAEAEAEAEGKDGAQVIFHQSLLCYCSVLGIMYAMYAYMYCIYVLHMTRNRIMVANLSGYVSEILALQTWSKIDFPPVSDSSDAQLSNYA